MKKPPFGDSHWPVKNELLPRVSHQNLGEFRLGVNAVQMTLGTVAEFAGALIAP